MNLLTYPHTLFTLFKLSWKLFQKNLVGMLVLTVVLLAPSLVVGLAKWFETESVVFFLSMRVLESAMALGVIAMAHGSVFPPSGILRRMRSSMLFGSIHVAILQYLLFVVGVMGLTVLPFPFNFVVVVLWLAGLFYFSLAQPVFVLEGLRGMQAMVRSFRLVKTRFGRVFMVVGISMLMQFILFALFFRIFLPDLNLQTTGGTEELQIQLSVILQDAGVHRAMRLSQYLTALLFFPFAALLTVLLYFDLLRQEGQVKFEQFNKMANQLFGTPLQETVEPKPSPEE